ncbi:MAG: protein kinase domain-containing protein [Elusimicrobiota bacterium]
MSKKIPFLTEVIIGLLLSSAVAWSFSKQSGIVETLNLKTYDALSKFKKPKTNTDSIHIVEIDEASLTNLGRWPWPRALMAQLIDEISGKGAKIIGLNVLYNEEDQNQGLEEINKLKAEFSQILGSYKPILQKKKINMEGLQNFLENDLNRSSQELNGDAILKESIQQAVNVILPMYFQPGDSLSESLPALPAYFDKEKSLVGLGKLKTKIPPASAASLPLDIYGESALSTGHSNLIPDLDGTIRRIAPVMKYGPAIYPSFGLEIVREYLKYQRDRLDIDPETGTKLLLGKASIPLDEQGLTYLQLAGPAGSFKRISALDVLSGAIDENGLKDKIILVGVTAPGAAEIFVVSGGERFTGLEIWATFIENILNQRFITRPPWAHKMEWGFLLLGALCVVLIIPFIRARFSVPITAIIFVSMVALSAFLLIKKSFWVTPAYAAALIITGFIILVGKRLIFTEKGKELVEAEGVETNKMLGLSFQGQGMLDLAFEKFRKCPVDDQMKELLYNLGLDMERKRQFSKAAAVYEHISTVDIKYKDIASKIEMLKKAGEGAVFGGIGKKGADATVMVEGLGQSTTLGRYEVVRELGRGAMGIVYLGKDPKINRQVAIKTMRFEEDMDEIQAKTVKDRFFREAESAGNLTHPNIVRIFDAGEDQDVAYIAMELLEGEDLKKYTEKANLLPIQKVLEIVSHIASGLDYAHKQGVVHRDIKPGNIMLLKDETLRITDFGIARIQQSSKTATGAVLGTPAYMSPEQVNGKKVDGRADIFSLGVTLFELLTGEKPFQADSIAALLYRIANVEPSDAREYNPNIPVSVINIISKSLQKDPINRYQSSGDMFMDLQICLRKLKDPNNTEEVLPPVIKKTEPIEKPLSSNESVSKEKPIDSKIDPKIENNKAVSKDDFLSELENTFKSEKTLAIEKTVTFDPSTNPGKDIPLNPNIEKKFQPDFPKDNPEQK